MKGKCMYAAIALLPILALGCRGANESAAAAPAAAAAKPQMNMLQLMRAFPFPHANVIFDLQGTDPEGPDKTASMSFSVYRWWDSDTYAGWAGVENSALALAEMAPLLRIPRACANGKPAPVDDPEWQAAIASVASVGREAHEAALSKNLDAFLDVSERLTNACAQCHDLFRDVDLEGGERCSPR